MSSNETSQSPVRRMSPLAVAGVVGGALVMAAFCAWATTFTTGVMNWNWVIPFSGILALAAVAWTIGSSRWFGYVSYRDPGKRGFAQSWLGLVVFWLSVIAAVVGGALILFLSGYFSPATWQAKAISYSDAPFEVEPRAPYRQAQALLAKRAGNLSGRMSLATYVPNHPDGPRWTAIVDGNGTWQKMVGVVEWDPASGQVRDCRFEGPVDSLGGVAWNSLEREIHKAPGGRGHLVVKEDAWGWCRDGKPVVVVPLVQSAGKLFLTTFPSGVAVVTSDGTLTIDTEVSPGEYPGPVIPTSIARDMWQANNATDGFSTWLRKTGTYVGSGQSGYLGDASGRDDLEVAAGNAWEFLTRTADGRLVYVTPLSVYGSSQSVTAVAVTYADEIKGGGTHPETVIYRFEEALPSPGDVNQVIRAEFGDLPWAAGLSVMEVAPVANGRMAATLGQTTVATWRAEITASPSGGDPEVCITSLESGRTRCSRGAASGEVGGDGPEAGLFGSCEELSDAELAALISEAAEELARRAATGG